MKEFIIDPSEMRELTSIRFANVPQLASIAFPSRNNDTTENPQVSPFVFPVLTNFLYCKPIAESLIDQAKLPRNIENKHPNDRYHDIEYHGHVVHEVPDVKKDIDRLRRELYSRNS